MIKFNTVEEFEQAFDDSMLDYEYVEYIMENCHGDRVICNGHTLTAAMEDLYLYEDFRDSMIAPVAA
jgi:hypothetical protein